MVGRHNHDALRFANRLDQSANAQVNGFHRDLDSQQISGMPHHIAVGIIDADEVMFLMFNRIQNHIRDFSAFHPGSLLKRQQVGRYLDIVFKFLREFSASVPIRKIGDVTELLRFADGER